MIIAATLKTILNVTITVIDISIIIDSSNAIVITCSLCKRPGFSLEQNLSMYLLKGLQLYND